MNPANAPLDQEGGIDDDGARTASATQTGDLAIQLSYQRGMDDAVQRGGLTWPGEGASGQEATIDLPSREDVVAEGARQSLAKLRGAVHDTMSDLIAGDNDAAPGGKAGGHGAFARADRPGDTDHWNGAFGRATRHTAKETPRMP